MDRLNHVKIVTPDPAAVDRFLREVLDVPEGWPLGPAPPPPPPSPAAETAGPLTMDEVMAFRGGDAAGYGLITGSPESRQFQVFYGEKAHIWGAAIGTRHLERARERCVADGVRCTEIQSTTWGDGTIQFFFAEVGGIIFEVMRLSQPG